MIHVQDEDFARDAEAQFHEAFLTHTSTSPNYQILASLDLARRQVDLEGYGLVARAYQVASVLRRRIASDPLLRRYFLVLEPCRRDPRRVPAAPGSPGTRMRRASTSEGSATLRAGLAQATSSSWSRPGPRSTSPPPA